MGRRSRGTRTYGGKKFHLNKVYKKKSDAEQNAKFHRSKGRFGRKKARPTRVVKVKKGYGVYVQISGRGA